MRRNEMINTCFGSHCAKTSLLPFKAKSVRENIGMVESNWEGNELPKEIAGKARQTKDGNELVSKRKNGLWRSTGKVSWRLIVTVKNSNKRLIKVTKRLTDEEKSVDEDSTLKDPKQEFGGAAKFFNEFWKALCAQWSILKKRAASFRILLNESTMRLKKKDMCSEKEGEQYDLHICENNREVHERLPCCEGIGIVSALTFGGRRECPLKNTTFDLDWKGQNLLSVVDG